MKARIFFLAGIVLLFACNSSTKKTETPSAPVSVEEETANDSFKISEVIPDVECKKNNTVSYALYLPHRYAADKNIPVLIFADPHGDGTFPLNKYHLLAEEFGVVLIGSNNSKNGVTFDETTLIFQTLVDEAAQRIHCNAQLISLAGFSGGAKAILVAASTLPSLLSVVYCGAGVPQIQGLPPALGIAGLKDMNYTEVLQTDEQLELQKINHAVIEWPGRHEWSDNSVFSNAFYWITFKGMAKKLIASDEKIIQPFISANAKQHSDPLQENLRLQKLISFLSGVRDVSSYSAALATLKSKKTFQEALVREKENLEVEARMKQNYVQCIDLKDLYWWHDEANRLRLSGGGAMNDRVLGYISLACYSLSNNALRQQDYKKAEKYLAVYSFVDRENPDRAYMQATLYAMQQSKTGALQSLREAISYGFSDKQKLMNDDSFAFIRNTNEFNEVLRLIR